MADDLDETMQRNTERAKFDGVDSFLLPKWQGVDIGTHVLYELESGVERPAVVVNTFGPFKGGEPFVNLCVFLDGRNDERYLVKHYAYQPGNMCLWATSVHYAEGVDKVAGTWHWPIEGGE